MLNPLRVAVLESWPDLVDLSNGPTHRADHALHVSLASLEGFMEKRIGAVEGAPPNSVEGNRG